MPSTLKPRFPILVSLLLGAVLAASCTLIGQGHLNVANDLSGIGADNTTLRAYVADSGDVWPPPGQINLFVRGDDFGKPPSYGMNGYLYLVRTELTCPQSEGAPESFTLNQVTITGIITVKDGSVDQFVTMQDTQANRASRWALIEINELAGFPGEHLILRCGTVTWTSGMALVDPCTLRTSLEGQALTSNKSFALDASTKWQLCTGGAAAGSNEKFLFQTVDGGAIWTLISRTTLGNPPPEPGVGEMPNGTGAGALFFQDANKGWLGLTSPGANLFKSTDGGKNWTQVNPAGLDPGVPVLSIAFTSASDGSFTTPEGTWTTSNGGTTWTKVP